MAVQRRLPRTTPSHRQSHQGIWGTYYNPRNAYYNDLGIAYYNNFVWVPEIVADRFRKFWQTQCHWASSLRPEDAASFRTVRRVEGAFLVRGSDPGWLLPNPRRVGPFPTGSVACWW